MAITVDTLLDENDGNVSAGNISLREAIAFSNVGDSIGFASSLAGGTIILTQGDLVIDKGLTITGLGADRLIISGNNASRVFKVDDGQSSASKVVISGLTIANGFLNESLGSQSRGAGIFNAESLTLTHTVIRDNKALFGGGIDSSGNLSIANSTINNNFATLGGGGISSGSTEGTVHVTALTNTTISGNNMP
ncbi:MAG: hypothetical protein HY785_29010 [Oscillatoriophycideae cyanobacterium NC_groundwater_1537_Pr4_S-0.65um_50_18]|nr:hypothetical protein [Oscillatoriophycideae cyanobacterium NC_groundwater_1537_Pr4_S-0.65um_50_18]